MEHRYPTRFPKSHPLVNNPIQMQQVRSLVRSARPGQIYLVAGNGRSIWPHTQMIADVLGILGPLRIILGGNRYKLDYLPVLLGRRVIDIYTILNQIKVSRAETCYQMLDALQKTPGDSTPLIVMELLSSFYDENLSSEEVTGVLNSCVAAIIRLSKSTPIIITADPDTRRPHLIDLLYKLADGVVEMVPNDEPKDKAQPNLFNLVS
jgi:hypothetical protein